MVIIILDVSVDTMKTPSTTTSDLKVDIFGEINTKSVKINSFFMDIKIFFTLYGFLVLNKTIHILCHTILNHHLILQVQIHDRGIKISFLF